MASILKSGETGQFVRYERPHCDAPAPLARDAGACLLKEGCMTYTPAEDRLKRMDLPPLRRIGGVKSCPPVSLGLMAQFGGDSPTKQAR